MVIYKPDTGPVTVQEAIDYLRSVLPKEPAGEVFMPVKEDGSIDWDGPIDLKFNEQSDIRSQWLETDFLDVCRSLGIQPRNRYRPHLTDFTWSDESASYYTITHDELVRFAGLYHVAVQVRPDSLPQKTGRGDALTDSGVEPSTPSSKDWVSLARERAVELIARDKNRDLFPSQELLAEEIARAFRRDCIVGPGGKPLSAGTIKRHALKGISSAIGKQLSTALPKGK